MNETHAVTRRAGVVAASTLASRVLGLVRDMTFASMFSPAATDVFFVAFTIPNTFRRLVGEGALTVSLVPVLTQTIEREGGAGARRLISAMGGIILVAVGSLALLGTLLSPWLVWAFGAGLARFPGKLELAGQLTSIMFSYLLFASLLALAMGALNTAGRFFAPAFSPVLLNLVLIASAVLAAPRMERLGLDPLFAVALGVLCGGALQVAGQLPALAREGLLVRPRLDLHHPGVRRVLRLMAPSLLGVAAYQLNVVLSRFLASFLAEGSVTYLYYAFRLVELPQGLFVYALAGAVLPTLSTFAARNDLEGLRETYRFALRMTLFVALPAAVGLAVLAWPVVVVVLQRGEYFDAQSARETARALLYQAPGLVMVAGVRQTVPVFFAQQDTFTPIKAGLVNLVCYAALALLLMGSWGHAGISLAISLAAGVQFVVLVWWLRRRLGGLGLRSLVPSLLRATVAATVCGATAALVGSWGQWTRGGNEPGNIGVLALAVTLGMGVYLGVARALGSQELHELGQALRGRGAERAG